MEDLRDCAQQRHVFSCRLEFDFETCTVFHTQSDAETALVHFQDGGILGDPGAASRDEGIFVGESLLQLGDAQL